MIGGRKVKAVQSSDTIVHPAYRGRGIFSRLLVYGENRYQDLGCEFVFGFPNENSMPGFLKSGWKPVIPIRRLNYVVNWRRVLERFLPKLPLRGATSRFCAKLFGRGARKGRAPGNTRVDVFGSFPEIMNQVDDLYNRDVVEFVRSKKYMEWRVDRHPSRLVPLPDRQ